MKVFTGRILTAITPSMLAIGVVIIGSLLILGCGAENSGESGAGLRTPWGEPDLMGVWRGEKLGASPSQDSFNLTQLERLYRPEGRARMAQMSASDDPTLKCLPPAFPQALMLGWPIQIVQKPRGMIVLTEAFSSFRNIPTDGRGHLSPDLLIPLIVGDSAGHWEGETLVVDVISFRDAWLARSADKPTSNSTGVWPTSESLHVVERWRRVDADTLEYQARVEDDGMLTAAWETPTITLRRQPAKKIPETMCVSNDPTIPPAAYLAQFGR